MKTITLNKIRLENFKGIKLFELDPSGGSINVHGDNGTGKTTLFDSFVWLLFDKDSQNKKDFTIKTTDVSGNVIAQSAAVTAEISVDDKVITLKKVYSEKWTKKRGSATSEFSGHTTDYYIDDVPCQKKEYDAKISEIVPEELFKLITSPAYFNEQLSWQERRKLLLEICGDMTDDQVIKSSKALAPLEKLLEGRKLDDYRKMIQAKRTEINKELSQMPVRIQEVQLAINKDEIYTSDEIKPKIAAEQEAINKLNSEIATAVGGGLVAQLEKKKAELETKIAIEKTESVDPRIQQLSDLRTQRHIIVDAKCKTERQLMELDEEKTRYTMRREETELEIAKLRQDWTLINEEALTIEISDTCPTCGQDLPANQIDEATRKAKANFNREKALKLERITENGKQLTEEKTALEGKITAVADKTAHIVRQLEEYPAKLAEIDAKIKAVESQPVPENSRIIELCLKVNGVDVEIAEAKSNMQGVIIDLKTKVAEHNVNLSDLQKQLAAIEANERNKARIIELGEREKQLAAEYEKLEQALNLTDEFVRAKVDMLEERINSKFRMARFKLFNRLINGGLEDCCETTYNGIPYGSGLNNAARINVGLDIIRTLSEHYGVIAPIFVDNAESVVKLVDMDAQVVRLVVDGTAKNLEVR